ncbi:unnamed protein product [Hermetia illucens]|uniref:Uncharacterized protein n=1 Tax=Hermetia illucens TaxID=343691 RepID=A0A7R8V715_HERIL|nr:unnamed protein product [Hermetia illucens]
MVQPKQGQRYFEVCKTEQFLGICDAILAEQGNYGEGPRDSLIHSCLTKPSGLEVHHWLQKGRLFRLRNFETLQPDSVERLLR